MTDAQPPLIERLEADLAAVEHAIERLERIAADEDGDAVGAGDADARIRSVIEVAPFLDVAQS